MRRLSMIFVLLLTFGFVGNAAADTVCNVWWDFPPDYGISLGSSFTLPECQDAFNHWWIDRCAETVNSSTDTGLEYWDGILGHHDLVDFICVVCTDGYPDGYCR